MKNIESKRPIRKKERNLLIRKKERKKASNNYERNKERILD